ncbi:TetR/AcrR family transcriptional regulator [Ferrimonas sp. YFM]|uniref:TetR/AcrR family transcriptional regulator n=1 Tax=Ferrimonas sp. YFM TaxID=3028878 RepID=UPI00257268AF|nr:TetR/AcrR family transcriptional regulator [Ferrimonas sp. YFM]BDY03101.1 TetR family transcriptional regulator [Ferrimonas sp. YFM]
MKTKDRIILASRELFNEHGERAITTNHIAAHMGISPGNLYYHFRNKEEIIRCIYKEYENYIVEAFRPLDVENESDLEFLVRYLDGMFQAMWRFRFFYANLTDILTRDKELHQRYLEVHSRMTKVAADNLRLLRDNGTVVVEDKYIEDLAQTLKQIVTCWISYRNAQMLESSITKREIYKGVIRVLITFRGIVSDAAMPEFDRIERKYRELYESMGGEPT